MSKQHFITVGLAAGLLLAAGAGSWANPNDLLNVPTADIMPRNTAIVQMGSEFSVSDAQFAIFSQAGVSKTMEVGIDHYLGNGGMTVGNVKVQIPFIDGNVAGGLKVAENLSNREWYLVYSSNIADTAPIRVHVGVMRPNTSNILAFGAIEIPKDKLPLIGKKGIIMLEMVGGADLYASAGAKFAVNGLQIKTGLEAEKNDLLKDGRARIAIQVGKAISL
jgi:hypothetical protein